MKLSYIIPLYNAEPFIGQCLDSVLDCDLDKSQFEVIVVDDGSTDNGLAVANDYADQYSNIRVFHQENQGQSVARNYGIKEAKGDYIWFVDSDDYVDATDISSMLEMMDEKGIEICKCNMQVYGEDGSLRYNSIDNVEYDKIFTGEQVFFQNILVDSVCSSFISRQFLLKNNLLFYPGIIHQDCEFSIRLTALAKRIIYVDRYIYYYRYNENSCTRSRSFEKKLKSHISDVIIASNIHKYVKREESISLELKKYLYDYATSISKGRFVSYLVNKDTDSIELYKSVVAQASLYGEYPIKPVNNQIKERLLCLVLNCDFVMRLFIRLRNVL